MECAASHGAEPAEVANLLAVAEALFSAHQDRVYALCLRFTGNPESARDLAQDSMLRAFQKLPGFRGDAQFSTWLLAITRYECLNYLRKRRDHLTDDGVIDVQDPARSVLGALRQAERDSLLRDAAAAVLDPIEQEAVHLRYVEHLPLARITELLELDAASGARGLLQRCKRKLGRELRRRLAELGHGSSFVQRSLEA